MNKRNIGNIFVSSQNYEAVFEMNIKMKHKNISHTIDQVITNYLTIALHNERLIGEIQKMKIELREQKEMADAYRNQLIGINSKEG